MITTIFPLDEETRPFSTIFTFVTVILCDSITLWQHKFVTVLPSCWHRPTSGISSLQSQKSTSGSQHNPFKHWLNPFQILGKPFKYWLRCWVPPPPPTPSPLLTSLMRYMQWIFLPTDFLTRWCVWGRVSYINNLEVKKIEHIFLVNRRKMLVYDILRINL